MKAFQKVFQQKNKPDISLINQLTMEPVQITPAHQLSTTKPALCGLCRICTSAKPGTQTHSLQAIELDNPGNALPTHKKGRHDVVLFRTRIHQNQ
ncbi:hypothetical protein [Pseudomonas sp. PS01299]|uniref:hypothetical protein n=1 Tax=Pseudomonas sp. PS01299 TaxID=2991435 RepID=UPI00249A8505|nr:hypothetical protein [Pseudomonas sp. PS01299]